MFKSLISFSYSNDLHKKLAPDFCFADELIEYFTKQKEYLTFIIEKYQYPYNPYIVTAYLTVPYAEHTKDVTSKVPYNIQYKFKISSFKSSILPSELTYKRDSRFIINRSRQLFDPISNKLIYEDDEHFANTMIGNEAAKVIYFLYENYKSFFIENNLITSHPEDDYPDDLVIHILKNSI